MMTWHGNSIQNLKDNEVFVFGSNPEGRHGAGAAKFALKFGAQYGNGRGLQGQSYALVTKNLLAGYVEPKTGIQYKKSGICSVSSEQITQNIRELYECARSYPEKIFLIAYTYSNRNLNGYSDDDLISMFINAGPIPDNISFHDSYEERMRNNNYEFFFNLHSPFSNFHPSVFSVKNITFLSNEQFMMFCKAKLFKDEKMAHAIMDFNDTDIGRKFISGEIDATYILKNHDRAWNNMMTEIKKCGRHVSGYIENVWIKKRVGYVKFGALEKFKQNDDLKNALLKTGDKKMVEASKYDRIWGIGLDEKTARKTSPDMWIGLNLLGHVLDDIKSELTMVPEPLLIM